MTLDQRVSGNEIHRAPCPAPEGYRLGCLQNCLRKVGKTDTGNDAYCACCFKYFCFHYTCDQCSNQLTQTMKLLETTTEYHYRALTRALGIFHSSQGRHGSRARSCAPMRRLRFDRLDNSKLGTALIARCTSAEEVGCHSTATAEVGSWRDLS